MDEKDKVSDLFKHVFSIPHVLEKVKTGRIRLCHKTDGSYVLQEECVEKYKDWAYTGEKSLDEIKCTWEDIETYEEKEEN